MSLRTSFWLLPQNEHFSVPLPSRVRAIGSSIPCRLLLVGRCRKRGFATHGASRGLRRDDFVDDPIFARLLRGHEKVPVGVALDLLHGLSRVLHEVLSPLLAHPQDRAR